MTANMPPYTLGQASKASGRSKPTILQAIRNGRLTATRNDKKQWQIDPAELGRVYPTNPKIERDETPTNDNSLQATIEHLRELLSRTERERDELSRRLDEEASERRKLTAILIDQRAKTPEQEPTPPRRRFFRWW